MTAETVLVHRHLPGLPLAFAFIVPGRNLALGSIVLAGAAFVLILISIYFVMLDSSIPPGEHLQFKDDPIPIVIESAGRLEKVYVTRGAFVHTGDPIVQLDTRHLLLRRHELESLIHSAEATPDDSSAGAAALYKELQEVQLDLDRLTVTSPVDGKILSLASVYPGKTLPAGTAIAVVVRKKE
jgi:multidrug resistance efflux pump